MATSSSQSESNSINRDILDKADSVTLILGPDKHELLAPANILTRSSDFFKTALKKEWLEGQTRTITMPDEDPETIAEYLSIIRCGRLPVRFEKFEELPNLNTSSLSSLYIFYSKAYILGSRLLDDKLKRGAIGKIHALFKHYNWAASWDDKDMSGHEFVNTIYDGTLESDPARRLLVDMYTQSPRDLNIQHHPEFLLALAQALSKSVVATKVQRARVSDIAYYLR